MAALDATPWHLGFVCADLDRTKAGFRERLGIERWFDIDADYEARYRGRQSHIRHRVAFAPHPGVGYLELVELGEGDTPGTDWFRTKGEGIYHLGYSTDDVGQRPGGAEAVFEVLHTAGSDEPARIVYLDTVAEMGFYVELLPRAASEGLMAAVDAATSG